VQFSAVQLSVVQYGSERTNQLTRYNAGMTHVPLCLSSTQSLYYAQYSVSSCSFGGGFFPYVPCASAERLCALDVDPRPSAAVKEG